MAKREERKPRYENNDGFDAKTLEIKRVTKVTKGGKTMRISALVVVGNKKGMVGFGLGKDRETTVAINKATQSAKKNLISVPIVNGTIPHEIVGRYSATQVVMLPAKEGNGIIAGGASRAVFELSGIKDITSKTHGSTNKMNGVRAAINGLTSLRSAEQVAALRGKTVVEL